MPREENKVGALFEFNIDELKQGLKEAKQSISLTTSEFQKSTAGLDGWSKSSIGLSKKIQELSSNMKHQEYIIANLKEQYRRVAEEQGENSDEAIKLLTQINKAEASYKKMGTQLNKYTTSLEKVKKTEDEVNDEFLKSSKVVNGARDEFQKATKTMVDWRSNADGVRAKLKQLNTIIPEQENHVKSLEKRYADLVSSQNYTEEEAEALRKEWQKQTGYLSSLKSDVSKYEKSLQDLTGETKDTKKENKELNTTFDELKNTMKSGVKNAIKGLAVAFAGYATSLVGVAESTREYRQDLSKLESNAKGAGLSLDVTKKSLKDLNAITGETDSNIEALSNLMMAGFKDNELGKAVETLSDAVIKFPDTLKVESLADSLQETLQQFKIGGNATGQYAELLERLGYNLDDVKEKTNKLKTEEEKRNYLLGLVNSKIGGTTKAYREQNKELVNASDAQFDLNDAMAELGEKAEPSISLVKSEVVKMLKELLKWVDKNLDVEETTKDVVDIVSTLGKTFLPLLVKGVKSLISVFNDYKPLIIGVGTALVAYNGYVKTAQLLTKGMAIATGTYNTVMGLFKTVTATATTATVAQTTAQVGLNTAMSLNPIGLVIAGVTALGVGLYALSKTTQDYTGVTNKQIEKTKENIKQIKEEKKARDEVIETQKEQINSNMAEMDNISNLNNELKSLVDENGRVKKGYESRVKFILNELSNATGIEVSLIDGQIKNYQKLQEEIDKTVLKKKAEIILSAQEEAYTQAIEKRTKAIDKQRQYKEQLTKAENELKSAQENYNKVLSDPMATELDLRNARSRMETATTEKALKEKQYKDQTKVVQGYYDDIATYENNAKLLASDNAEDWQKVIDSVSTSYKDGKNSIELTLSEQVKNQQLVVEANKKLLDRDVKNGKKANESKYKDQVEAGEKRLTELAKELVSQTSTINENSPDVVNAWKSLATNSETTFNNIIKDLDPELQKVINNMVYTVDTDGDGIKDSFDKVAKDSVKKVSDKKGDFSGAMKGNVDSVKTAVDNNKVSVTGAVEALANESVKKLDKQTEAKESGKNFVKGAKKGVEDEKEQSGLLGAVSSLGKKLVSWFNSSIGNHSPSHYARASLVNFLKGAELGLGDEENNLLKSVKNVGSELVNTFNGELSNSMSELNTSVNARINTLTSDQFNSGLGGKTVQQINNNFYQTNNSPKALSRLEIYRQTKNLLNKGV